MATSIGFGPNAFWNEIIPYSALPREVIEMKTKDPETYHVGIRKIAGSKRRTRVERMGPGNKSDLKALDRKPYLKQMWRKSVYTKI